MKREIKNLRLSKISISKLNSFLTGGQTTPPIHGSVIHICGPTSTMTEPDETEVQTECYLCPTENSEGWTQCVTIILGN